MKDNQIELSLLWDKVCENDGKSYADFHKHFYPSLYNYATTLMNDQELAQDILQEVFVKIWIRRSNINSVDNIEAYIFRSVKSMAIDHFRTAKVRLNSVKMHQIVDVEASAECIITTRESNIEISNILNDLIDKLPYRQKEILRLRFYEGMEYQQIVDITGIRYQSVVNNVYRAIQELRERYVHYRQKRKLSA